MVTNASPLKRLLVLGATGGTGKALVDQALERGHSVTAFVRSPHKINADRSGLTVVSGNPRDESALAAVMPGHDAVLSALGPPGPGKTTIVADGARATVAAMKSNGVARLLVVGVAVLFEDIGILGTILRRTLARNVASDSAEMDRMVRASDLVWTIVRPPRLTNGPLTGQYEVADDHLPSRGGGAATISRADGAHFLLEELERGAHRGRIVGVAYAPARLHEMRHRPQTQRPTSRLRQPHKTRGRASEGR
jgi:putative NADH-flavin reductase